MMTTRTATMPPRPGRPPRRAGRLLLILLAGVVALVVLLALGLVGLAAAVYARADTSTVGKLGFANELKVPPLLAPRTDAGGRKVFDLRLQAGSSELLPGRPTPTWGANGAYLGPTLRASRGDRVTVNVANRLPQATTIHWHGMHLPARADGGPHQLIAPGATWSPSWTIDQPAATLWYHPHPHGSTEDHVYRGISGLFLLDDPEAGALALPRRYGVDDIPLVIQDKRLDRQGRLDFADGAFHPIGRLGGDTLVNGTYDPHLDVASQRVRFRLLNASTARFFEVGFADGRGLELIGSDGGLLDAPPRVARVPLSPGERAEVVATFRPGERPVLRSFPPHLGTNSLEDRFAGGDDSFDLLQVRAAAKLAPSPAVPERLVRHQRLDPGAVSRTRTFDLDGFSTINGREMDMGRVDQTVPAGSTEVWEVRNRSGNPHSFHVHDVQFKVVDYAGGPRPATLDGWKDTVFVPPGGHARLLVRFGGYADPAVPYMFHCHLLRHEDSGMMGQFVVTASGQEPARPHRH